MGNQAVRVINTTGVAMIDPASGLGIEPLGSIVVDSIDRARFYVKAGWSIAGKRHVGKRGLILEDYASIFNPIQSYFVDKKLGLPKPTKPFVYGQDLVLPMACNDRLGCCTIAGAIHMAQLQAQLAGLTYVYKGDAVTESVYFGLTGGADTGLQLSTVINYLSKPNDLGYTIVGAASVDIADFDLMSTALYNFGALYLAMALPQDAERDFAQHLPWINAHGPILGGHCVIGNGTANVLSVSVDSTRKLLDLMTWASDTECDATYWSTYGVQCIVVVPQWYVDCGHDAIQNLDQDAMLSDLRSIGNARTDSLYTAPSVQNALVLQGDSPAVGQAVEDTV